MVRLGEQVDRGSERLRRGLRPVRLSAEDKAGEVSLDAAQMAASSSKGYRAVRATHGAHRGTWYYEARVGRLGASGAVRLGWATREAELQAPVGSDAHGYGFRSAGGAAVHAGLRRPYGRGFGEGDVVGCLLHLPEGGRALEKTADDVVKYKGRLYFTEDEAPGEARPLAGAFVAFWVNGEPQGRAFLDVREGTYYPALSIFTHPQQQQPAEVGVNFGEQPFAHPPPHAEGWPQARPASELPSSRPLPTPE
jgi:Set1/Ash2 histone methyltransferase complex subunit ASH2